ncbi:hypothetical protein EAH78_25775 [Pseudomonas arsenicoxydans]|uniref:Uncharacterized protein n=1 Tax=Pseudomonas arsenicoxydans TaxID=702115 RepID=A0A502HKZ0_9PSED|nr:hypothetical protein EAH78_25775 [Pseudomonas arsenicoxydans]
MLGRRDEADYPLGAEVYPFTATGNATQTLWRGSLLPLGCEAAPKHAISIILRNRGHRFATAAQPSGSKLPRHR